MDPPADLLAHALAVRAQLGGALAATPSRIVVAERPFEEFVAREPRVATHAFAACMDAWRSESREGTLALAWLSYDALRHDDPTRDGDHRPVGDRAPHARLLRSDAWIEWSRETGRISVHGERAMDLQRRLAALAPSLQWPPPQRLQGVRSAVDAPLHRDMVETIREQIRAGNVYLVNVARMLHTTAPPDPAQWLAARLLRAAPVHAFLAVTADATVAGMSMERALAWDRRTGLLTTEPIKGTRRRGASPDEDARNARALESDPKERSEHVMAVDVHRNDLGRVARAGTVEVPVLAAVRPHRDVWHMVSRVTARAESDVSTEAVLRSVLPCGSVTGAPKRSAMTRIAEIEPERRGIYTGVYGIVRGDGSLDLAVAIRTAVCDGDGLHYGAGGGIVIGSDPAREWEEIALKERAFRGD